jgi:hypothetical protein
MLTNTASSINNTEKSSNKDICNGFGCINQSTSTIDVDAGKYGTITLEVCQFCINKFQNKGDKEIGQ